jgi:hypothetical protein
MNDWHPKTPLEKTALRTLDEARTDARAQIMGLQALIAQLGVQDLVRAPCNMAIHKVKNVGLTVSILTAIGERYVRNLRSGTACLVLFSSQSDRPDSVQSMV